MSDAPLRERFRELRRHEERAAPDFRTTAAAARRRGQRERRRPRPPLLAAVAAAIALALLYPKSEPPSAAWTAGRWAMPSDVLLELPGSRLLRELPAIGTESLTPTAPRGSRATRRTLG